MNNVEHLSVLICCIKNTRLWIVEAFEEDLNPVSSDTRRLLENDNTGISAIGNKFGDELFSYYAVADCFVMPSYREGFPNTVLEVGTMGLPSIIIDINSEFLINL